VRSRQRKKTCWTSWATWSNSSPVRVSQVSVEKAARAAGDSQSSRANHRRASSTWRSSPIDVAAATIASVAGLSSNSVLLHRTAESTSRHHRSRRSLAGSGASMTRVQHLQVVADVAGRDPQLGGKRPNGTGLARPQRAHEAAPRGMRQGRQHGGVGENPDGA